MLFRGNAEGNIRKEIVKRGYIKGVIGLPANLFYGTGIPACILVFKKNRNSSDDIMFIDASQEFEKVKTQNVLTEDNIQKIMDTYTKRTSIDKYSKSVSLNEIIENDFNLNIPRYVDTFEEEEPVDLNEVRSKLQDVNKEIEDTKFGIFRM